MLFIRNDCLLHFTRKINLETALREQTCSVLWFGQTMRSGNLEEHEIFCLKVCDIPKAPNETIEFCWCFESFQGIFGLRSIGFLLMFLHCENILLIIWLNIESVARIKLQPCIKHKTCCEKFHISIAKKYFKARTMSDINATRVRNKGSSTAQKTLISHRL